VQVRDDVTRTSDEAEVGSDARPDSHASVEGAGHQNDAAAGADGTEFVVVAVFLAIGQSRCTYTSQRIKNYDFEKLRNEPIIGSSATF